MSQGSNLPWRHQAITLTNVDLSSTRSSGIHSRAMFTWIIHILILRLCLKLTHLKSQPHLPGDNELNLKWKFPSPRWCRSFLCGDTLNSYTIEYSKTCANGSYFHTCKQILVKIESKYQNFHSGKCIEKCCLKVSHFLILAFLYLLKCWNFLKSACQPQMPWCQPDIRVSVADRLTKDLTQN